MGIRQEVGLLAGRFLATVGACQRQMTNAPNHAVILLPNILLAA